MKKILNFKMLFLSLFFIGMFTFLLSNKVFADLIAQQDCPDIGCNIGHGYCTGLPVGSPHLPGDPCPCEGSNCADN